MKRAFVTMSAAAAALLLTACQDQGSQQQEGLSGGEEQAMGGQQAQEREQMEQQAYGGETAAQGQRRPSQEELLHRSDSQQVQGEVSELNETEGSLTLRTQDGQQLEIHGTPQQLQQYQQGQQANLDYVSFEGTNWIANPPAGGGGAGQEVAGRVSDVKAAEGRITLEGVEPSEFRAHPENLSEIQPGQQVSITYEAQQDVNWANRIQQEAGQQGAQEQQQGTQQETQEQGGY